MSTLADDLAIAKQLLEKGRRYRQLLPPDFTEQQKDELLQMAGGLIVGADTTTAYHLLERFVAEIERLRP